MEALRSQTCKTPPAARRQSPSVPKLEDAWISPNRLPQSDEGHTFPKLQKPLRRSSRGPHIRKAARPLHQALKAPLFPRRPRPATHIGGGPSVPKVANAAVFGRRRRPLREKKWRPRCSQNGGYPNPKAAEPPVFREWWAPCPNMAGALVIAKRHTPFPQSSEDPNIPKAA